MKKLIVLAFALVTIVAFSANADDTGMNTNTGSEGAATTQTHHHKKHEKKMKKSHHKKHNTENTEGAQGGAANTGAPAGGQ